MTGLFQIEAAGISTRGVVQAAQDFIEVLSEAQRSRLLYPGDQVVMTPTFMGSEPSRATTGRFAGTSILEKEQALELIRLYVDNLRPGHAERKLAEIVRHWSDTWFSWVGATGPESVFYYRFHSPVVMIEFDHQLPVALDGPALPTRDHVHTVVRTPNGNDYGKDLLRQHLEMHRH